MPFSLSDLVTDSNPKQWRQADQRGSQGCDFKTAPHKWCFLVDCAGWAEGFISRVGEASQQGKQQPVAVRYALQEQLENKDAREIETLEKDQGR